MKLRFVATLAIISLSILVAISLCLYLGFLFLFGTTIEHGNVAFDISPDGEMIVFSDANGDLWLFSLTTEKVERLTSTVAIESTPSFSPDGKSIVYASAHENGDGTSIYLRSIDGTKIQRLSSNEQFSDYLPSFSPDGKTIAFARAHWHRPYSMGGWTWDNWDVYVIDADGTNIRRLTQNEHYDIAGVSFSADSKQILFSADEKRGVDDSKHTLFVLSLDGTANSLKPEAAGDYYAWISEPYSSGADNNIVFISDRLESYHYDVRIMNRMTGKSWALDVIDVSQYNQNAVITKDGTTVLFLAGTEWNAFGRAIFSLWQVNSDGSDARQLADSSLFTCPEEWLQKK